MIFPIDIASNLAKLKAKKEKLEKDLEKINEEIEKIESK